MVTYSFANDEWLCDEAPSECPLCHSGIDPRFLGGVVREKHSLGGSSVEIAFQCPRPKCHHIFIGRYDGQYNRTSGQTFLTLRATTPFIIKIPEQPPEVAALSPQFVAIYGEAAAGEGRGLMQIAGCGYRKALEFLIKDFCVSENPADAEVIRAGWLGTIIEERIADPNIKAMAKRATWLGNDETHYIRLWIDKDMTDLKRLIALTVSWINTHQLTKLYMTDMPEGKQKKK